MSPPTEMHAMTIDRFGGLDVLTPSRPKWAQDRSLSRSRTPASERGTPLSEQACL